jgi:hypothetical protein
MARFLLPLLFLALPLVSSAQPVFVNEIHYDNAGTDADEAIEIAGPYARSSRSTPSNPRM